MHVAAGYYRSRRMCKSCVDLGNGEDLSQSRGKTLAFGFLTFLFTSSVMLLYVQPPATAMRGLRQCSKACKLLFGGGSDVMKAEVSVEEGGWSLGVCTCSGR